MNLDELQSVQARERQSSDLQHLRSSFYREVGDYIAELTEKRAHVVESATDPFSEPEVRRLTDDIETAEATVEAIYERRVGKVVKKASIAAAGMPVEADGLTDEEAALFSDLVTRIEGNREAVLSVLDDDSPTVSCSIDESVKSSSVEDLGDDSERRTSDRSTSDEIASEPDTGERSSVDAAELMGGESVADEAPVEDSDDRPGDSDSGSDRRSVQPVSPESSPPHDARTDSQQSPGSETGGGLSAGDRDDGSSSSDYGVGERSEIGRTTVRITADVGEIVGADDRDYDLGSEDVVTLPEPNAEVLVEKNAAERL